MKKLAQIIVSDCLAGVCVGFDGKVKLIFEQNHIKVFNEKEIGLIQEL